MDSCGGLFALVVNSGPAVTIQSRQRRIARMIRQLQILGYRIEPPKPQANQISEPVDLCQVEILFSEFQDRRFRLLTHSSGVKRDNLAKALSHTSQGLLHARLYLPQRCKACFFVQFCFHNHLRLGLICNLRFYCAIPCGTHRADGLRWRPSQRWNLLRRGS